ncbi:Calmodulin and related proteins (EF-Hand superfamily) [Handroanthus impetiginosus]|uniref:Calmodulin and related proteins (EF-Hand superfamily) n=1 Tax=Handroanthus impetiginosus TaxID=429701 RepID=A0A2G9GJT1_9LAMI|nr:Calmodulin and related proteins (EF-Hand superfamily) [Handroanthus impetiginosus]
MAIANITKPFSSRIFKLRLPRRLRSKPDAASPASPRCGGMSTPRTSAKDDEFRQVFRFLDADNDGRISADELKAYFASVGESVSHADAVKIIKEFSADGDEASNSLLSFEEFVRIMELRGSGDDDVVLRQAFEVYEVEKGSGCITAEGLREVLCRLGDVKTLQECRAMIGVYDLDGNGVLDFNEFYKMMI